VIEIDEEIAVPVPVDRAWSVLADPHAVVGCVKGAEIVRENADGSYDGRLVVQFGPMRVGFAARVSLELDAPEMSGRITARGRDQHGATRMSTAATFAVGPAGNGTSSTVRLQGAVTLTGALASTMEAGASSVVRRMTTDFTENLIVLCAPDAARDDPSSPARPSLFRRWREALVRWLRPPRGP
jgi:uncharacterized protein